MPLPALAPLVWLSPQRTLYGSLTTPDPIALHRSLDELAGEGVTHLALEASSHGLDQLRLDGVKDLRAAFRICRGITWIIIRRLNIILLRSCGCSKDLLVDDGVAVVAADHAHSQAVIDAARARKLRLLTVGRKGEGIRLIDAAVDGFGQRLTLALDEATHMLRLPLVGEFQIENALVAAGLVIATGGNVQQVLAALEQLEGAKGRLELVGEHGAPVFGDYAQLDALEKALTALRPYAKRRLVVVFGAGGDRDAGKRPLMGEIAARNADRVIVTDDNPRSENPALIRAAILARASGAYEIGDLFLPNSQVLPIFKLATCC